MAQYERRIAELERKVGRLTVEVDVRQKKGLSWDWFKTRKLGQR